MSEETKTKVITLGFAPDDMALYEAITEAAKADERTPSKFLHRYLKQNFPTPDNKTATQAAATQTTQTPKES